MPHATAATDDSAVAADGLQFRSKISSLHPDPVEVTVGDTITWTNEDGVPHTATQKPSGSGFQSGTIASGSTFSFTFDTAGTFEYFCEFHPKHGRNGHRFRISTKLRAHMMRSQLFPNPVSSRIKSGFTLFETTRTLFRSDPENHQTAIRPGRSDCACFNAPGSTRLAPGRGPQDQSIPRKPLRRLPNSIDVDQRFRRQQRNMTAVAAWFRSYVQTAQ